MKHVMVERESCYRQGFLHNFFTALLSVSLFFLGMAEAPVVYAQFYDTDDLSLSEMLSSPIQGVTDLYKIEGAHSFKDVNDAIVTEAGVFDGEVAPGQKIRVHFYLKVRPFDEINEKRKENGKDPLEHFKWNCTIYVKAKNGDKEIGEYKQSHDNAIDNTIEYQVPKDATQVSIGMKGQYTGQFKGHDKPFLVRLNSGPVSLSVNKKYEPVPLSPAIPYSADENTAAVKPAEDKTDDRKDGKQSGGDDYRGPDMLSACVAVAVLAASGARYLWRRRKKK